MTSELRAAPLLCGWYLSDQQMRSLTLESSLILYHWSYNPENEHDNGILPKRKVDFKLVKWTTLLFVGEEGQHSFTGLSYLSGIQRIDTQNTPWKINMEPTNHTIEKENDLNQTSMIMFQPLIFRGVTHIWSRKNMLHEKTLWGHWDRSGVSRSDPGRVV